LNLMCFLVDPNVHHNMLQINGKFVLLVGQGIPIAGTRDCVETESTNTKLIKELCTTVAGQ
jgi:hypothetical protein